MTNPKPEKHSPQQALNQMAAGIYADRKAAIENAKPSASQPKDFNALAEAVYASRRGARA